MQINLGSVQMPLNAATKSFAILAKRGAGKTYLGGVFAEELHKNNIPFVVFDPIDVWWGLKLAADGKSKGLPVVVFGLRHADIALDRDMGRDIARAIVKENISCVISTFGMSKKDMRHVVGEIADELLLINNTPRQAIIEEAHEFVPQRVQPGAGVVFARVEALVTMGRNQGIGVTMLNQRAATLNKDVLSQIDTLLALRSVGPQDRKAISDWVEFHGAKEDVDEFVKSLPTMPTGEGWIWSPEFLGIFKKFKIRKRETFHPDREKIGQNFVMPQLDQGDVQSFIGKFKQHMEAPKGKKAKSITEDTSATTHTINTSVTQTFPPTDNFVIEQATRDLRNEFESKIMAAEAEARRWQGVIAEIRKIVEPLGGSVTGSVGISLRPSGAIELWKKKLGSGLAGRLLNFFAENPGLEFTRAQACLGVGVSPTAGHTNNEWPKLMRTNTVVKNGDKFRLNPNL